MNCYLHEDVPAVAYCRSCGRPLCGECQRPVGDTVFCQEHFVQATGPQERPTMNPNYAGTGYTGAPNPYLQTGPAMRTSPGLAFALGIIPGVGAIYNGQYLKGLVHAIIFGLLISLANSSHGGAGEPLLIMIMMAFVFYMPFEAYHTARKRLVGVPVEEFSSLVGQNHFVARTPIGPILLIAIGVLFLLDTLHLLEFRELARFWPVVLILVGAFMLYGRVKEPRGLSGGAGVPPIANEYSEPRQ